MRASRHHTLGPETEQVDSGLAMIIIIIIGVIMIIISWTMIILLLLIIIIIISMIVSHKHKQHHNSHNGKLPQRLSGSRGGAKSAVGFT